MSAMDDNSQMSFWDHLETLRWVIIRVVGALVVFIVVGFAFIPWLFDNVVLAPTHSDFWLYRLLDKADSITSMFTGGGDFNVELININLASQFFTHVSLSFWLALILTFPYIVFEVWRFICPALYENERAGMKMAFTFGTVMFFIGCFTGYMVVFPMTLRFLYTYQISPEITNQLSLNSYMDNFLMLIFLMGIMFELPLLAMLLSKLGLLDRSFFGKYRRHAIVALLLVAAIITPSSDPFTLMVVFLPLYILWELSAFLVKPAAKEDSD